MHKALAPARIYVVMTDTFMTEWGESEAKENSLVIKCPSLQWAQVLAKYIKENRDDMAGVHVDSSKPASTPDHYIGKGWFKEWVTRYRNNEEAKL